MKFETILANNLLSRLNEYVGQKMSISLIDEIKNSVRVYARAVDPLTSPTAQEHNEVVFIVDKMEEWFRKPTSVLPQFTTLPEPTPKTEPQNIPVNIKRKSKWL